MRSQENERNWSRIALITLGFLFVFLFVGTYILSILSYTVFSPPIREGQKVEIDLTIRDRQGRPILTTSQQEYSTARSAGYQVFFSAPLVIVANATYNETMVPLDAYYPPEWVKFGMMGEEMEMIARGVVGHKKGERLELRLSDLGFEPQAVSAEEFESTGGNFTQTRIGDQIAFGFYAPTATAADGNTTGEVHWRVMEVVGKDESTIRLSYGYEAAEVSIREIGAA